MLSSVLDWLDSRTGYRAGLSHLLDERLPQGTGWAFTSGSVLTLLLGIQFLTGIVLAMYYIASPTLAYDSVRFIMRDLPLGWVVRSLHVWGASFMVVAAGVHLLRVFTHGAYKAPREVTWLTGVVLLQVVLAFSLTGYLLPWDQKAYWATTVTINVARSTPFIGEWLANVLRGGPDLGALTLGRWYAAHVFLLPGTIVVFVIAHLFLMRRHGISGPFRPRSGPASSFFPWHVIKDTVVMAAVFALLITLVVLVPATLDEEANPANASYVPRPEWYFLSLFQLLKYFPGPLEPVATIVLPGLAMGFLAALPFIDRSEERRPWAGARRPFAAAMFVLVSAVTVLTLLGMRDRPVGVKEPDDWGLLPIAGLELATGEGNGCQRCHVAGGPAAPMAMMHITRDEEWLQSHMADPVAIAPGVRSDSDPAPRPMLTRFEAQAAVAYLRRLHARVPPPETTPEVRLAAMTYARTCVVCHKSSGEGGTVGPDLSEVGARRSEEEIRLLIEDPAAVYGKSSMPRFKGRLSEEQIAALAKYLAQRKEP